MKKLDEFECLQLWTARISRDKDALYTYEAREDHIQSLMELLLDNGIDQDSAQGLRNKVVETLVTKEGMRGKGKHEGWKENTQKDFDNAIQLTYVEPHYASQFKPMKTAEGYDPRKVKWAKEKFGDHVGQDIIIAVHQPLHLFWIMFMRDYHKLNTEGIV